MRVLLLNPNTSVHITERMGRAARTVLDAQTELSLVTATVGPSVIGTRSEAAIAASGALELAAREVPSHDAVVYGVSLDCGLAALRELLDVPVAGMTESGLAMASMLGTRLGLVTLGARMLPLYRELVAAYGFGDRVVAWHALEVAAAFAADQGDDVLIEPLADAAQRMIEEAGVEAIVLSGAALAGAAAALRQRVAVPLVDCTVAASLQAVALARMGACKPLCGSLAAPRARRSSGLAPALAARLLGATGVQESR